MTKANKTKGMNNKDAHHVLIYLALVTGAVVTILISVLTIDINTVTVCPEDLTLPNSGSSIVCQREKATSFGWPFTHQDGGDIWPSVANYLIYSALIFGIVKAEAHHKGHMPTSKHKKS